MKRYEQRLEDTWNMEDIYASQADYDADVRKLTEMAEQFKAYRGRLSEGADALLEVLKHYEAMRQTCERLNVYAGQRYHQDTGDAVYQKLSGEMQTLTSSVNQACAWLEPELLALPSEKLDAYFEENKELEGYRRQIEVITRAREHILDDKTEVLLSRMGEVAGAADHIYSMFNNADIRFPDAVDGAGAAHTLTIGRYISYLESQDRVLRKSAFESLYSVYRQYRNTVSAIYYANAKQADVMAKERKYEGAMEAALDANAIPVSVYKNLVKTINDRLPAMHRYVALRKKMLGVDELHMYDVYVPLVNRPEKEYSFEEAGQIVKRALAPLGEDYQALLQEGFDHRWIDRYENEGKRTGAYSWGPYGVHPYVLMNYHGSLSNVFTLAHEMGHSLHSWYSDHALPFRYAGYKIFVAEVASTCNEALMIHDLMDRTEDPEERSYLINYFLDKFRATMFRQAMFAEFEMNTHAAVQRGETLTADYLCKYYHELNQNYFGPDMVVDEDIAYEWERIPHFYTPFYVYQYSTGFAAAIAISSKILAGEPGIVEKYKKFLSSGCSMDPIDLLKLCDVDMSTPEPVCAALDVFEQYLDELEKMVR